MLEKADELVELLLKHYLNGELSPDEAQQLKKLTANSEAYGNVYEELSKPGKIDDLSKEYFWYIENFKPIETRKTELKKGKLVRSKLFWRLSVAASVFLVLAIGAYFWFDNNNNTPEKSLTQTSSEKQADLAPGQNKAVLTLADGKKIILDSAAIGQLTQGTTKILNKGGHIIYNGNSAGTEVLYNTLSTAKAEIYSMVLSDGTRIWLNASSSIRFPVVFKGAERKVEISGEVYFDVAHNKSMPFKVLANGMEIEVLGTSFNINCYKDEASMKTTLLEGKVKVRTGNGPVSFLKPGQQAQVFSSPPTGGEDQGARAIQVINNVDLQQAIAWKNGYFQFYRDDLQTVMRQIARWYDVEVVYEGEIPRREFQGKLHRNTNASEILKILEKSKIHFRIEGKKIIVTP